MKTRKNKKGGNVLFIMICAILVAAIGVSGTLAYLTARSVEVDNTFKAKSEGISGEWVEPMFDSTSIKTLSPGITVAKDPSIVNTTPTDDGQVYVGARMSFWIEVDDNGFFAVDLTTFQKFVTINNINTASWSNVSTQITQDVTSDGSSGKAQWYFYDTALAQYDGTKPSNSSGTRIGDGSDNTSPLFTSVTLNPNIRIEEGDDITYVAKTDIINDDITPSSSLIFEKFNFQIKLDGCGVNVSDVEDAEAAKTVIMEGMGGTYE